MHDFGVWENQEYPEGSHKDGGEKRWRKAFVSIERRSHLLISPYTANINSSLLTSMHGCILSKISETNLLSRTRRAQSLLLATVLISAPTETTINESGEAVISVAMTVCWAAEVICIPIWHVFMPIEALQVIKLFKGFFSAETVKHSALLGKLLKKHVLHCVW